MDTVWVLSHPGAEHCTFLECSREQGVTPDGPVFLTAHPGLQYQVFLGLPSTGLLLVKWHDTGNQMSRNRNLPILIFHKYKPAHLYKKIEKIKSQSGKKKKISCCSC